MVEGLEAFIVLKHDLDGPLSSFMPPIYRARIRKRIDEITEVDMEATEVLLISEFDSRNLSLAESILAGTWDGDWHNVLSPEEWASNLLKRWVEKNCDGR